jgi:RNA polymerase sigma-70 factor (ECF subfamily)
MQDTPKTRPSLLLRIQNTQDSAAWREFVELYQPLLYRLTRRRGFQHADALELSQEALLAVARHIGRWEIDPHRGSFRNWLCKVTRNLMINFLAQQRRQPQGVGKTDFQQLLARQPDPQSSEAAEFDLESRRQQFHWAAQQVQHEFQPRTWAAFWETCVLQREIKTVAAELDLSTGAVYVARSRVMARLRQCVQRVRGDVGEP